MLVLAWEGGTGEGVGKGRGESKVMRPLSVIHNYSRRHFNVVVHSFCVGSCPVGVVLRGEGVGVRG